MAKNRYTGRNATVSVESTSAGYLTVGLLRSATPPPKEKASIDVTGTTDSFVVVEQGIATESRFTFQMLYASTEDSDAYIQTCYGNSAERPWRVRRQYGASNWDSTFTGMVAAIRPTAIGGNDPVIADVDVVLTSAICDSVA